jgi:predicted nucleic acid-binding protein
MIVVDTSVFIDFLRGKESSAFQSLILSGVVLISSTVYLELLQGVRKSEETYLNNFLLSIGAVLNWPKRETCKKILKFSRGSGIRVGLPDIIILADALDNKAKLLTFDSHMARLAQRANINLVSL